MSAQLRLDDASLPGWARRHGLLDGDGAPLVVEPAGDGNINWVRRLRTPRGGSVVVKQARPALERFPQYEVTTERIVFEARFYEVARPFDPEGVLPAVRRFEERDRVLVLEDLGAAPRLDAVLAAGPAPLPALERLAGFLGRLHAGTREEAAELAPRFANDAMRRLHGDHIFRLPLEPNDFPLPPRTRERARALAGREDLRETAARAYARYLRPEGALVHADVQAGNVLLSARGAVLLDAEIAHVGDPAFDVGSLVAHLLLPAAAAGRARAAAPAVVATWGAYAAAHGPAGLPRFADVARYAGLEMLRRTVGAARVPAVAPDEAGLRVLDAALPWILDPPEAPDATPGAQDRGTRPP